MHEEFGKAFVSADVLFVTDVYAAGEAPIPGISGKTIVDEVRRQAGQTVHYIEDRQEIAADLKEFVQPGDLVITMGAGNIYQTGEELVALLQK